MKVAKLIQKYHITLYLFLVVVVSLSISRKIFIISLWPWILSWLLEGNFRVKFKRERYYNGILPIWMLFLIFTIYSLSLLWSDNMVYGSTNLGELATMVLIPFFIVFSSDQIIERNNFKIILKAFLSGLVISSVFLIIVAFSRSLSFNQGKLSFNPIINGWENLFLYYHFSFLIHPSYYAMMLLMAISICFTDIEAKQLFPGRGIIPVLLTIYFIVIVLLTSSRAAFIALLVLAIYHVINSHIKTSVKIIIGLIMIISSVIYISVSQRFQYFRADPSEPSGSDISELIKTNIRKETWRSSLVIIKENPIFGVGLGDEQDELYKIYEHNNYSTALAESLNCHNQFLQTWLSTGIFGLLILIFSLVIPLTKAAIWFNPYYISFLIIITIMFFFESMFDRVWGVAFFSIFYTLLTINYIPGSVTDKNNNLTE